MDLGKWILKLIQERKWRATPKKSIHIKKKRVRVTLPDSKTTFTHLRNTCKLYLKGKGEQRQRQIRALK